MYFPGSIIYFTPFYFSNSDQPRNKYCIILKVNSDDLILFSLATTTDSVPRTIEKIHGCINNTDMRFNCYFFNQDQKITKNKWGFPRSTYIYGEQLKLLHLNDFQSKYKFEGVDYQLIGELTDKELKNIIHCMRDSVTVARKYRRILGAEI